MKISLKKIRRKWWLIGGGAVLGLLVIMRVVGDSPSDGEDGEDGAKGPPVAVQIAKVGRQQVEQTVTAAGKIRPVFEMEISSTVSAQIMELRVDEGDEVEVGDTLVVLDRLRYEAAYDRAKSGQRSAKAGLRKITAERGRGRQLYEKNLISLQEMEALEASYESALSLVDQAKATQQQAGDDLSKTILTAPGLGVVTMLNKELGEMALGSTFQADVLLIISDLSSMEVVVEVDETDVVDIELFDLVKIEVDAIQDTVFAGRVSKIAHSAIVLGRGTQEQATNFEVVVTLDINPESSRIDGRIRPGMSATAIITTALHESVLAVPIQALTARAPVMKKPGGMGGGEGEKIGRRRGRRGSDGTGGARPAGGGQRPEGPGAGGAASGRPEPVEVVFVVAGDSSKSTGLLGRLMGREAPEVVEQRPVKLGISSDTHYEILSGLAEGEEIVTGNYRAVSKELRDGSRVTRKQGRPERRRRR